MNRIKILRDEKGWTQTELGKLLNVKDSAVSKYESEKIPLTAETLRRLSEIFGVSVDYILGNSSVRNPEGTSHSKPIITDVIVNRDKEALDTFRELSPEAREKAAEYIEMLKTLQEVKESKSNEKIIDFKEKA